VRDQALENRKFLDRNVLHCKEKDKRRRKVKERIHRQTRFKDNYNNRSPAMTPEMLVDIS
jgi:hypothetical protein